MACTCGGCITPTNAIVHNDRIGRRKVAESNHASRKLDWKLLRLQGLCASLGSLLGNLALQNAWGAALGAALGALIAVPIGRKLTRSR